MEQLMKKAIKNNAPGKSAAKPKAKAKAKPAPKKKVVKKKAPAKKKAPPKPKLDEETQKQVDQEFKAQIAASGEKAPSEIAEALADDQLDQQDADNDEPSGFFGKFIKKQKDKKK